MRRISGEKHSALVVCALLASLALTGLAWAQGAQKSPSKPTAAKQAPEKAATETGAKKPMKRAAKAKPAESAKQDWYSIAVVQVKPEMIGDWQDLQKSVVIPALRKAGLKERSIWETATFGPGFEYVVVTPISTLAQYDDPSLLRKTLGEDGYKSYTERARKCTAAVRTFAIQSRPDLSYVGKVGSMTGPPKLAVVTTIHVVPGHTAAFESVVKTEVVPAMKKGDALGYFVSQTQFGGDANEFSALTFYDSFADIGKGSPILRALGSEGLARLTAKLAGVVSHMERSIVRYNPELSIAGEP